MSMEDWVSDVNSTDDDEDAEADDGASLFQDNFRRMVSNDEVDSLNAQTVQNQVDQIDDKELLAEAVEVDDRDDCVEAYRERLGELHEAASDDEEESAEPTDEDDAEEEEEEAEQAVFDCSECGDIVKRGGEIVKDFESDDGTPVCHECHGDGDDADDEAIDPSEFEPEPDEAAEAETVDAEQVDHDEEAADEAADSSDESDEPAPEVTDEADEDADETTQDDAQDTPDPTEVDSDGTDDDPVETGGAAVSVSETTTDDDDLPDVDVSGIAPNAKTREEVAAADSEHTLLVWGPEGSGKSHIAHSAPQPVCYIDTEGKADELADKFDKKLYYWTPDDYKEAKAAMERALDVLAEYREQGVTGTIVVDSMTVMWEWAKIDYAKFAYQTDDLTEVNFQSELEGSQDWAKIKARHNDSFRSVILNSPYHTVFTSGQKEDYNAVMEGADGKPMTDDGEKRNRYAVKDVVRVRVDDEGDTVADLHKAGRTKYSFIGLKWPEWDDIYEAIGQIAEAEQSPGEVDITGWPFDVVEGQPVTEGSDDDGGDDGN